MDKAILPRLCAFLRHGGYGSCEESYPAVVPFVSSIPKGLWGNKPALLVKVMESAWQGMQQASRARWANWDQVHSVHVSIAIGV